MESENISLGWKEQFLLTPAGQWAYQHKSLILSMLAVFGCLAIGTVFTLGRSPGLSQAKRAQETFLKWKDDPTDAALLEQLEQELRSFSALRPSLRGEMAQVLLNSGKANDAVRIGQESLDNLREVSPLHEEYAEISLLISRGEIQKALEGSVSLKEQLKKNGRESTSFYASNLIRIAFLQQKMGNGAGENAAWAEWLQFSEKEGAVSALALKGLGDEKLQFSTYLESRKSRN